MSGNSTRLTTGSTVLYVFTALVALLGFGCREQPAVRELSYEEMSPADVLVSVNGRSLTKGEVATKLAKTYQNALRQPGGNANLAGQTVLEERGRIVDAFVGRRLVAASIYCHEMPFPNTFPPT